MKIKYVISLFAVLVALSPALSAAHAPPHRKRAVTKNVRQDILQSCVRRANKEDRAHGWMKVFTDCAKGKGVVVRIFPDKTRHITHRGGGRVLRGAGVSGGQT